MSTKKKSKFNNKKGFVLIVSGLSVCIIFISAAYLFVYTNIFSGDYDLSGKNEATSSSAQVVVVPPPPPMLDKVAYDLKLIQIANYPAVIMSTSTASTTLVTIKVPSVSSSTTALTASSTATSTVKIPPPKPWPVQTVYPNYGALLPFNRIVAYYGNFLSTSMGVLGQYPPEEMLRRLATATAEWQAADPTTPAIPAIDYIAVTAQGSAGADGKYRARMSDTQLDKAVALADQVHGIVILELQVGLSDVQTELPLLEKYLKMPQVHLALDPEFSMHNGARPGSVIGTMDATDINFAANYLAQLVRENNLPPKIIVVHRFTTRMLTNYRQITPLPEVQMVIDMDGWSIPQKKVKTYLDVVQSEPVQFTGFKLFYKNDLAAPVKRMMTPTEVLKLQPQPSFIQYQ